MMSLLRRNLLCVGAGLLLALCACEKDTTAKPQLTVEVYREDHECFAPCDNSSPKDARALLGDECDASLGSRACGFEAGRDRLRLTVDYGAVEFDAPVDVPAPTLTVRLNDAPFTPPPALAPHPRGRNLFFTATMFAPVQAAQSFSFTVGSADFAGSADDFSIHEPRALITLGTCATCPLTAGAVVPVTVSVPAALASKSASLLLRVNTVLHGAPVPVELTAVRGGNLEGSTTLTIPDLPGQKLSMEAQAGPVLGRTEPVLIQKPELSLHVTSCTGTETCTLVAGTNATLRLAVPRELATRTFLLSTTTDTVMDSAPQSVELVQTEGALVIGTRILAVPDAPGSTWRLRAEVGTTAVERELTIAAPVLSVEVANCPTNDEPCTLSAGVGSATVTVTAPFNLNAKSASLTWTVDGVPAAVEPLTIPLERQNDRLRGARSGVPAPDRPGAGWRLVASVGRTAQRSEPIHLVPPRPIRLRLVAKGTPREEIDFGASGVPQRASGEPDANCRELLLAVDAPDAPQERVTFQSNLGMIDGRSGQAEVRLTGGRAYVPLVLPPEHTASRTLQLSATATPLRSDLLAMPLVPVYPIAGSLFSPTNQLAVGASGSASTTLKGHLHSLPDAPLVPGTPVALVVSATPSASTDPLPCGRRVPPEVLSCDPTGAPGSSPGGCLLAPVTALVDETGRYTVTLTPGLCFAGEVTIEARGRRYLGDSPACLGERAVTSAPQSLGQMTLSFVPMP